MRKQCGISDVFPKKMAPKASTQPTPPCCIDRPGERDGSPGFHEPWRIGKACLEYVDTHHQRLVWVTKDGLKRAIWSRSYDGGVGWRTEVFEDSEIEAWLLSCWRRIWEAESCSGEAI